MKTADTLVLKVENKKLKVLLAKRSGKENNFSGKYCIPGGKVENGESLKNAAIRELREETNIDISGLSNKMKAIDHHVPDNNVSWKNSYGILYVVALPNNFRYEIKPQRGEVEELRWYEVDQIPYNNMAFDHGDKIKKFINRLNSKLSSLCQ